MHFNELIIPSDLNLMTEDGNPGTYGRALLDMAYRVRFHDFEMDLRGISFTTKPSAFTKAAISSLLFNRLTKDLTMKGGITISDNNIPYYSTRADFFGSMILSDNMAMDNNSDFDRIAVKDVFTKPAIAYEESKSKLNFTYEDFITVDSVVTPEKSGSDGIVEYNTDFLNVLFNAGGSELLNALPVEAQVRMGHARKLGRYFFALGMYYQDTAGVLNLGLGKIDYMTSLIGYNLDLLYTDEEVAIPNSKQAFFQSIKELPVDRTPMGNIFFVASMQMSMSYGPVTLGELRNVFMVVEKGPHIEMGADYYGPSDIESLATGKNLQLMGTARLGYYPTQRLFKLSVSLYDLNLLGTVVNGDLGFDMSPEYWELRIGYPRMLSARMGTYYGGFGFTIRNSKTPNDSYIKAQIRFEYDTGDVSIWPVYVRAYLYVGGNGEYYFDSGDFVIYVYIEGGASGGIKVAGKKYDIVRLTVGADGTVKRKSGDWSLDANVRVSYHLDLFLLKVKGSVNWHLSTSF